MCKKAPLKKGEENYFSLFFLLWITTTTATTATQPTTAITIIPATGKHDYQVTESTDATCTEKGSTTYACSVCGDTYTEETDFADHDYKEVETKDATCTENGYVKYECPVCGDTYEETIKATGHDDGKWVVTKEASLFNSGERTLKCTVCGEILDTEEIAQTCPIPLAGIIVIAVVGCVAVVADVSALFVFDVCAFCEAGTKSAGIFPASFHACIYSKQ